MNKTIIININGTVFHIEESAYEILKQYMTAVKRHFFDSADSLEITTDIENRVAELFSEILARENRQAIIDQDVNYVIGQMGAVEDFDMAAEEAGPVNYTYTRTEHRRLFRDADDHLIGGVCAGIANYFDIQSVWIRLAFALSTLFAGTGLIVYIILWLVIPKAITRADRMAMKGEKLNLEGFKKNFEAEMSNVRERIADAHHEAKPFIYKFRDFIGEFFSFTGSTIGKLGQLLIKLIGLAFLLSLFGMAISLIVLLISVVGFGNDLHLMFPFSVINYKYTNWLYFSAFVTAITPIIALILLLMRAVFNTKSISRSTGSTLLIIWICALSVFVYFTVKVTANFRSSASIDQNIQLKPVANNTYHLKLNNVKFFTKEDSARLNISSRFHGLIVIDNDDENNNEPRSMHLYVEKSDVAQPVLIKRFKAKGRDYEEALNNARNTTYGFLQKDSILTFDSRLHRLNDQAWHAEEIQLILRIPLNYKLVIDKDLDNYMGSYVSIYGCASENKTQDNNFARFVMTDNGLQCSLDTLRLRRDSIAEAEKHIRDSLAQTTDSVITDTVKVIKHVKK